MCLYASHYPRRRAAQTPAEDFFGPMRRRTAWEGTRIANAALRQCWRQPRELDDLLGGATPIVCRRTGAPAALDAALPERCGGWA